MASPTTRSLSLHDSPARPVIYDRIRDLAPLLPLWPRELTDLSMAGRRHVIARLERALRDERRRGFSGHWSYDLVRHAALAKALKAERQALAGI